MKKIGFIGLGVMGKPMAKNLLKAGYPLMVYDIVPEAVQELVAAGAQAATSSKEAAAFGEVIMTMLPTNSPEVKEVVLSKNGVLERPKTGKYSGGWQVRLHRLHQEISAKAKSKGLLCWTLPVKAAKIKRLTELWRSWLAIKDAFEQVGQSWQLWAAPRLVGEINGEITTKLAKSDHRYLNIAAMSEAMVLATKGKRPDPEKVFEAIRGGLAGGTLLTPKSPGSTEISNRVFASNCTSKIYKMR